MRRLTQELELTQSRRRTVREESDAANEQLRAANEELQSINEEYRSTSEELETSKEELQSINFEGRLSALASVHTLLVESLVESEWKGADLAELANQQLALYRPQQPDRLRIEGERVLLPADLATPFGLVLHELATNAARSPIAAAKLQ